MIEISSGPIPSARWTRYKIFASVYKKREGKKKIKITGVASIEKFLYFTIYLVT